MSLPNVIQPAATSRPITAAASPGKKQATGKNAARSFASWMESYSQTPQSSAPRMEKSVKADEAGAKAQGDTDESHQPKLPEAIPVQVQVPILPISLARAAPLAAELTTTSSDQKELTSVKEPVPGPPPQPESEVAVNPPVTALEGKLASAHLVSDPLPVVETLAPKEMPNLSTKMDVQPPKGETDDHPLRPPTTHLEAKVAGVDDLNMANRPSTSTEWMASPRLARGEQTAKSADASEVAFTATIKEAVQPVKAQASGGKSGQQESNSHERSASDGIQPGPQPQVFAPGGPEKSFQQTVPQVKPAEVPKPPDMTPVHPVLNERTANAGIVNSISLRVDSNNSGVDVKLMERDGTIQLSVRTSDFELSGNLRGRLNELVDGLSGKGYETQTWTPDAGLSDVKRAGPISESRTSPVDLDASALLQPQVSATLQSQNDARNFNQGEPGKGGTNKDQPEGRQPNGEGREQRRRNERQEKPKNIFRTILEGARP